MSRRFLSTCAEPGCPILTDQARCPVHRRRREYPRPSTSARGYGKTHQRIASRLRHLYPNGPCGRCGQPGTWDNARDPLTAGHIRHDGPTEIGNYQPEHRSCGNREMASRRGRK
jgi:hypothetical protein